MLLFYYKRCVINVDNKNPLLDEEKNGLFIDNEELVLPDEIKKEETEEKTLKEEVPIVDDDVIEKTYSYNDTPEPREVSDEPTEEVKSIYLEDLEKINREKEEPVEEEVTIEIPEREEKSEEDKILDEKPVIENTESTPFISLEPDNKEEPSKEPAKKEESHDKDNKSDKKAQITTAIFTVIVLLLLFITLRNFYYGFKYKDYDLNNQTTENEENKTIGLALKDISLDSIVMNNTAKKINADYCLGTSNLVEVLYTDKKVNMNSLSITEVETILFNYLNKNECTETPKELKKEEISMFSLLNTSLEELDLLIVSKNIEITLDVSKSIKVIGDFTWLKEAILNIVKNGIEHSKENGKIEIMCTDNPLFTELVIKDYGLGISKKDLPHIFKRFYKTSRSNDSVGIGLNLSKSIFDRMNATVKVKSKVGEYTIFTIHFYKNVI